MTRKQSVPHPFIVLAQRLLPNITSIVSDLLKKCAFGVANLS